MATPRTSSASEAAQSGDGDTDATSQPAAVSALSDDDLGSSAQRERRKRILDATLAIASKGGYEAVQMRTVAERADVAVGTLYR
ncbi:TetR family transcriptional regulator [Mycobacteroides abscessus subsp. abscessus]|nr:TetR family transcriptional regulator [Mycobacteroides abscessus subsp. abscessus]